MNKKRILHNIYRIDKQTGGPAFSLKTIAEYQSKMGHEVIVIATKDKKDRSPIKFNHGVKLIIIPSYTNFRYASNWEGNIIDQIGVPDIIHTYGLWNYHNIASYKFSKKYKIPHILAPCGMLYKDALIKSFFLKKVSWLFYQSYILKKISHFHAKSIEEKDNIHSFYSNSNISIVPNPIEFLENDQKIDYKYLQMLNIHNKKIIFFIGRLTQRKGLAQLIKVWNNICSDFSDWCLVISGNDKGNHYYKELVKLANNSNNIKTTQILKNKKKSINPNLVFSGAIYGIKKYTIFSKSSIFINPSDFENFGQTIGEACYMKLPLIISTNTPWSKNITEKRSGWVLQGANLNMKAVMTDALSCDEKKLKKMGEENFKLIKKFKKNQVYSKLDSIYDNEILKG